MQHLDIITMIRDLNDDILQALSLSKEGRISQSAADAYIARQEAVIAKLEDSLNPAAV